MLTNDSKQTLPSWRIALVALVFVFAVLPLLVGVFYSALTHTDAGEAIGKATSYTYPYMDYILIAVLVLAALQLVSKRRKQSA